MNEVKATRKDARASWDGKALTVRTDAVERVWRWTGGGLVTASLRNLVTGKQWAQREPVHACDWSVAGLVGDATEGRLAAVTARAVRRGPWTSDHVEAVAEVRYPSARLRVQLVVWAYPGSGGIRTHLRLRGMRGWRPVGGGGGRAEYVPVSFDGAAVRAIGYYNQTQQRNRLDTPLLREEVADGPLDGEEAIDWASLLCIEAGGEGLCLVKESHKCVNQPGVDTGAFVCSRRGVEATGLGPAPGDVLQSRFRDGWANWCIVYSGGDDEREAAVKAFDRRRYPIDPKRDLFVMANTWGSTSNKRDAQAAASEANVLRELDSAADLGLDVQQIDDGWQGGRYRRWRPCRSRYPDGWANVRAHAKRRGVTLGLWAAVRIGAGDLIRAFDEGGFRYYKLDFANLDTYGKVEEVTGKARRLIEHSGHTVRVNWDVTEIEPRVGYFFARELGNIYLANRKPAWPPEVVYAPHTVLRDAWQLSRYLNLNQFQITVQNADRVDRARSNAWRHPHDYCLAVTLMGSPIFFQETHYYDEAARAQLRPLLAAYKRHRREMFEGFVYPVGDEPNDRRWTGFQCHLAEKGAGYLTVFREIANRSRTRKLPLRFVAGRTLRLRDLMSGEEWEAPASRKGAVRFEIDKAPGFRFLRYEVE